MLSCGGMKSSASTVASKFQITLPEDIRRKLQIDVGDRIQWEVRGDVLVGKRLPSIMELAGCLKSIKPPATDEDIAKSWPAPAVACEKRIKKQK